MPIPGNSKNDSVLSYTSFNPSASTTVLLIHGACATGQTWDLVVPHLVESYHVLVPDLPGHGASRDVTPFSVVYAARLLEKLMRQQARGGKAHVVGHSLGECGC